MSYEDTDIGTDDGHEESLEDWEDVASTDYQHKVSDTKRKANDCEEEHEDEKGRPKVLRLQPDEDFFGWALECHEEHAYQYDEGYGQ